MLSLLPRILMSADVPPRPPIKSPLLHMRNVIRDKVVAERIAFIHRAPQLACLGVDCDSASCVPNAVSINLQLAGFRITCKDVGTIFFRWGRIGVVVVRA